MIVSHTFFIIITDPLPNVVEKELFHGFPYHRLTCSNNFGAHIIHILRTNIYSLTIPRELQSTSLIFKLTLPTRNVTNLSV
uniref:Uncharacterized protein n=1 Tax=Bracon brevicornis TaxID=1563983 RepID=A0A6V7I279_9HYME